MNKKILLVYPNTTNFGVMPLAISILSSIAKKNGYEVRYFETTFYEKDNSAIEDRKLSGETKGIADNEFYAEYLPFGRMKSDFLKLVLDYSPAIIGVHCNSPEYELFCEDLADGMQDMEFRPFIIAGGCHPTVAPTETIANPLIDAICIGEGEDAWHEFLLGFQNGRDISSIRNLWVKTADGVKKNTLRSLRSDDSLWEADLDLSFFDDRHIVSAFDGKLYRRGQMELSRGCPYDCSYCVNSGFKSAYSGLGKFVRTRPFENVRCAIKKLVENGCHMIQFQDECFLAVSYDKLKHFLNWYGNEIGLPMMIQTRPETVTEEKIRLLAGMNVPVQLSLGIESGNKRILKEICKRNMSPETILNAFNLIKKYDIRTSGFTMIGFPSETRYEVFDTIKLVRKCSVDVAIMSTFFPFPGIPLRQYCIDNGFITGKEKIRKFTGKSILKSQPMSPEEIESLRRCFALYTKLPEEYFPQIEKCERDYSNNIEQYKNLVDLLYRKYYVSWKQLKDYTSNLRHCAQ